jgi:predicted alpha/beta superfamily hydrolase
MPNITVIKMKIIRHLVITAALLITCFNTMANVGLTKTPFDFATTLAFDSKILNEKREVNIYLPANYSQNTAQHYPVIYLLDGSKDEDFIHITGLVQFGNFSWINMLPQSIVVGIANRDRKHDFTTTSNNELDIKELPTLGGAKQFIRFIEHELQPLINSTFRTNNENTLIGQSLGGLLASEILFNHSALFERYVIVSPSLWWDDEKLLATEFKPNKVPKSVYIGVGKEGTLMERVAKALYSKVKKGTPKGTPVYFNYFEQLDHGDTLHLATYDAFKKMYLKPKAQ